MKKIIVFICFLLYTCCQSLRIGIIQKSKLMNNKNNVYLVTMNSTRKLSKFDNLPNLLSVYYSNNKVFIHKDYFLNY